LYIVLVIEQVLNVIELQGTASCFGCM
jgi:hypothetical protein